MTRAILGSTRLAQNWDIAAVFFAVGGMIGVLVGAASGGYGTVGFQMKITPAWQHDCGSRLNCDDGHVTSAPVMQPSR